MKAGAVDRRVQRTRQMLREALTALTLERGYQAITVQDILDRANLGRSTFYAHFRNKDELMLSGFESFLHTFEQHARQLPAGAPRAAEGLNAFSLELFRHVAVARPLLKSLFGRQGGSVIIQRAHSTLAAILRQQLGELAPPSRKGAVPLDVAAHHLTSSLMALMTQWLDQDLPYTAEEMAAMWRRLVLPGLAGALQLDAAAAARLAGS